MHPIARNVGDALAVEPTACRELDGGMIGQVHRVDLADGASVVAKTGETPLSVEASMLRYLEAHTDLPVPAVLSASDDLLVIEYVDGDSTITPAVEGDAADHLAALHDHTSEAFGFPFETLCGPLAQPNPWTDDWIAFFREHRLCRQARGAREEGPLDRERFERVQRVADDLSELLVEPDEPALIHGDVWRTNVLAADGEVRAFLDPAIYYAHPEVELAYVDWTDTFGDPFFERYRSRHPIEPGFFEHRRFVYRLYPLLVHVRLFGSEYLPGVDATLTELGY
ncbi:fructosamine kinase family protein [Halorhabdus amylolytica]|uniref:fructosamine kinase family protein n=1 Tax=Halorhabdus amylolytica TaxID=2559573 RepID=UPI0020C07ABB|nr:fructosamine kinase family protein [Halorhabdus amylolytica]